MRKRKKETYLYLTCRPFLIEFHVYIYVHENSFLLSDICTREKKTKNSRRGSYLTSHFLTFSLHFFLVAVSPSETLLHKINIRPLLPRPDRPPNFITQSSCTTDTYTQCPDLVFTLLPNQSIDAGSAREHLYSRARADNFLLVPGSRNE